MLPALPPTTLIPRSAIIIHLVGQYAVYSAPGSPLDHPGNPPSTSNSFRVWAFEYSAKFLVGKELGAGLKQKIPVFKKNGLGVHWRWGKLGF